MAKRKRPRGPQRSRRRQPRREPYDRVLVVCEGTKTEPDYFREIVEAYRLSSANVVVASGRGSDPESVVATAVERYEDDPDYEGVYVVVDRDTHAGYAAANLTSVLGCVAPSAQRAGATALLVRNFDHAFDEVSFRVRVS